jgi:hypothetical protein
MIENDNIVCLFLLVVDDDLLTAFSKRFDDLCCLRPSSALRAAGKGSTGSCRRTNDLP